MASRAKLSTENAPADTPAPASASRHVLVIGGQRSGKSAFAEGLVDRSGLSPIYLATGTAGDPAMSARIATHRQRRGDHWSTIEEPLALAAALQREAVAGRAVLVDCLTLWLTNLHGAGQTPEVPTDELVTALSTAAGAVVLVSGEVGAGIIPDNAMARQFADDLGTLNQHIAAAVGRVILVSAGQPVLLKPASNPEFHL